VPDLPCYTHRAENDKMRTCAYLGAEARLSSDSSRRCFASHVFSISLGPRRTNGFVALCASIPSTRST